MMMWLFCNAEQRDSPAKEAAIRSHYLAGVLQDANEGL